MVKNRAAKDAARKLKASTGITYPRALERSRLNGKNPAAIPPLRIGKTAGEHLVWQPGPGSVLEISGPASSGKSEMLASFALQAAGIETYVIDVSSGAGYQGLLPESSIITGIEQAADLASALEAAPRLVLVLADESLRSLPQQPKPAAMTGVLERLARSGAAVITATQMPDSWHAASDRILLGHNAAGHQLEFLGLRTERRAPALGGFYRRNGESTAQSFTLIGRPGSYNTLGIPDEASFFPLARPGLYLFTGTLASGKSTSLAAVLNDVIQHAPRRIALIEETEELTIPDDGLVARYLTGERNAADVMTEALRTGPAVVAVGEIRDPASLLNTIRAAATGHTVYATMHVTDPSDVVDRICDSLAGDDLETATALLPDTLRGVLHHEAIYEAGGTRIVRTLVHPKPAA